jgi:hypothetical protein
MMSPNVLRYRGFVMWFSAHDAGEPPHVHVSPGQQANPDESAKFWITSWHVGWSFSSSNKVAVHV